jgi:hemoglobin/transferrin/lactoferrin receptor protein
MRAFCSVLACCSLAVSQQFAPVEGIVLDPSGASVPDARIAVISSQGTVVRALASGEDGRFRVPDLPRGSYALEVRAVSFAPEEGTITIPPPTTEPRVIRLQIARTNSEITVTSQRGAVQDVDLSAQFVASRGRDQLVQRPNATVANALEGTPGVTVQQTTAGAASPILHGMIGYDTLLLLDGIRFNTSIYRNGPNQYAALVSPGATDRIEVSLGPNSANYGSDSLGGTINMLTPEAHFAARPGYAEMHGEFDILGASADLSGISTGRLSFGGKRFAITGGGTIARHNDLRAGGGDDSHNVFRRYFGLNRQQLRGVYGDRLQNTGFLQYSADARFSGRLGHDQTLSLSYLRSDLQNVRSYRDQYGGANKIQSAFNPQDLNFAYARYEKLGLGPLDSLSATVSLNQQNDGAIQQNALATDIITTDSSRVNSYGYSVQGATHFGGRATTTFGGEIYSERIFSTEFVFNPVSAVTTQNRALYPNNSLYRTSALFLQNSVELLRPLRAFFGLRYTGFRYNTYAAANVDSSGKSLGVVNSSRWFGDITYKAGLEWRVSRVFSATANVGRGFRAPNVNDLGTVGARTLGYDVTGEDAVAAHAYLGLDSSDGAALSGKQVRPLGPETLMNYETGFRVQTSRLYVRLHFFDAEYRNPITTRTLLFPLGEAPASIGGVPVTPLTQSALQKAQGVVAVVTALTPRAVHTAINDGKTRYFGTDSSLRFRFSPRWTVDANYSFLGGLDLNPVRPTRRLPPQEGALRLRYTPSERRPWLEASLRLVGPQARLNSGDIDDDRIGGSRRRSDIQTFFRSHSVSPYISPGSDGRLNTADDFFIPTGETLRQIQDRVLPLNTVINGVLVANDGIRIPLYPKTPGWVSLNVAGGYRLSERASANFGVNNVFDHSLRAIGSGIDAAGISVFAGMRYTF